MQKLSLRALAREHLEQAARASAGRSATTVYGGHERILRQTLLALTAGCCLDEHESPGDASIYVLRGRVRLLAGSDSWEGSEGDLLLIPPVRHSLEALADSAILLTVAKSPA